MQTSGSRMERRLYSKLYKITEVLYYRYSGGKNFISLLNRDIMLLLSEGRLFKQLLFKYRV